MNLITYGTLRLDQERHHLLPTEGGKMDIITLQGFKMFAYYNFFPALIDGEPTDKIVAEFWELNITKEEEIDLIHTLDEIEGINQDDPENGLYKRIIHTLPDGRKGYLYLANDASLVKGNPQIEDWNEYINHFTRNISV